jgi:hypothetical protein
MTIGKSGNLFVLCVGLFVAPATVMAASLTSLYTEAGDLYQAGQYKQAVQLYQQIVAQGVENGAVFYNLGNAYFQSGQLGRAMVNYHRALRYLPRDDDVATNLAYARSLRQDEIERDPVGRELYSRPLWEQRIFGFTERLTLNECGQAVSVAYFVFLAFLFVRLFWTSDLGRLLARYGLGVSVLAGLYLGAGLGWKMVAQARDARGVVVAEEVKVRNGPGEHAAVVFQVHDGAELTLHERREGWLRVSLTPNQTGWVRAGEVEAVRGTGDG